MSSGVPQSSILGPVLFLVYVKYLTERLISHHGDFADDYKICLHYDRDAGEEGRALQRDLDKLTGVAK